MSFKFHHGFLSIAFAVFIGGCESNERITGNKLLITFTRNIENPQINGIEIITQP
jgi:hypothetical protein